VTEAASWPERPPGDYRVALIESGDVGAVDLLQAHAPGLPIAAVRPPLEGDGWVEADMRRDVPEIADILTHIESEPATIEKPEEVVSDAELEKRLKAVASHFPEVLDVHDFVIKRVRGRMYISCHCTLSDDLSLARVHDIQTELEIRFKQDAPELFRVLIHPEPSTDNRR